jgi:hypothetical protein
MHDRGDETPSGCEVGDGHITAVVRGVDLLDYEHLPSSNAQVNRTFLSEQGLV